MSTLEISISSSPPDAKEEIIKDPKLAAAVQAEWNASANLRAEFGDRFSSYQAYRKAEAEGRVKVRGAAKRGA